MTISGSSVKTALAAAFMRSSARRSFGFSNEYLFENLLKLSIYQIENEKGAEELLVESSPINADDNPCVWEEQIWLLEGFHVFIPI